MGIFLLLGTNQGNREENLSVAVHHLGMNGVSVLRKSSLYRTAAWGNIEQPDFFNVVMEVATPLQPEGLLSTILFIEQRMGRVRREKWGQRLIDIDILLYHDQLVNLPNLSIPHPQIAFRRFTLEPLNEIASSTVHPALGKTIQQLLSECTDELPVERVT
jgi:2-amino-4-hydroxy-6-hydroxymethyldihydropteridine diphosphokinase